MSRSFPMKVEATPVGHVATPLPFYAKPGDAGLDLPIAIRPGIECRDEDGDVFLAGQDDTTGSAYLTDPSTLVLLPGVSARLPTGWAFAIPEGHEGQVRPRSSSSHRRIHVALGTIDAGYRGEVLVTVENRTGGRLSIRTGDRLAQLVIAPVAMARLVVVEALDATERGTAGHGSTGT